jgi:hypothetical protein
MPELTYGLAAQAANYIANHLLYQGVLPLSDTQGYRLVLELARTAGPEVEKTVRRQLNPLVQRGIGRGQPPPTGW